MSTEQPLDHNKDFWEHERKRFNAWIASQQEQPKEDKDWKEISLSIWKSYKYWRSKSGRGGWYDLPEEEFIRWIESFVQPLQSQYFVLQKEIIDLQLMWSNSLNRLFNEKEALQKEVKDLDHSKLVQAAIIIEQEKENAEYKEKIIKLEKTMAEIIFGGESDHLQGKIRNV